MRMQFYVQGIRNKATVSLEKNMVCLNGMNLNSPINNYIVICILSFFLLFVAIEYERIPISAGANGPLSTAHGHLRR